MPSRRPTLELTRRGWALFGGGCGLVVASRLLGLAELMALGLVSLALVGLSALWVRACSVELDVVRSLGTARIHVGGEGRIDLTITNRSPTPNPVLAVSERFGDGRRAARFLVPSLERGASARAAYRIPTGQRGRFALGPFAASVTDPFGLARRRFVAGPRDHVTVYPRLSGVAPPPVGTGGRRATTDAVRARAIALDGDEFTSLREYEIGDDLRKVHWPATARTGDLFIRQDVAYREPQVAILLDTRAHVYDEPGFETAVELVASLLARLTRDGRRLAIRTTSGIALCNTDDIALGLDRLAVVEVAENRQPLDLTAGRSAALTVVVTGALDSGDHAALTAHRRGSAIIVTTLQSAAPPAEIGWVDASLGDPIAAWNRAIGTATAVLGTAS